MVEKFVSMVGILKEGAMERREIVGVANCAFCRSVLSVLLSEGFISRFDWPVEPYVWDFLNIYIKYKLNEPHIFTKMKIVSSPASQQYKDKETIIKEHGLAQGLVIMSSTHGIYYYDCLTKLKTGGLVLIEFGA